MRGVNRVTIIGNLGGEPELRSTPGGTPIVSFQIATEDQWKDKGSGEQKSRTEWHRCEAWGRLAEVCHEYLTKGSKVYIEGSLRTDKYTDKAGIERWSTKIRFHEMQMLGGTKAGKPAPEAETPAQQSFDDSDAIPF